MFAAGVPHDDGDADGDVAVAAALIAGDKDELARAQRRAGDRLPVLPYHRRARHLGVIGGVMRLAIDVERAIRPGVMVGQVAAQNGMAGAPRASKVFILMRRDGGMRH